MAQTAAQDMFDRDVASQSLGIELIDAGKGQATVRMTITREMVNGHGTAHGGYVFLLADTVTRGGEVVAEFRGRSREVRA